MSEIRENIDSREPFIPDFHMQEDWEEYAKWIDSLMPVYPEPPADVFDFDFALEK